MTVISLDNASVSYGRRAIWQHVDFAADAGEYVAIVGGNGSGKTTLLRVLLGQLDLRAGTVAVFGRHPRRGDPRVGYVPQQRTLGTDVPLRGIDLVRLGLDGHRWGPGRPSLERDSRIGAAINAVDAAGFAERRIGQLSGGEQQRLRIAQALVGDPALVLADEPLAYLDSASQRQIAWLLEQRRRAHGTTVVVVTHETEALLPYVDRVVQLDRGLIRTPSVS